MNIEISNLNHILINKTNEMKKMNETIDKYGENLENLQEEYSKMLEALAQNESSLRSTQAKLNEKNEQVK
jgi:hypothetical protein